MKQGQSLRLGQNLAMTPALQQSIRLLQLSTLDLQQEIQLLLEQNIMLERTDELQVQGDAPAAETPEEPISEGPDDEREPEWEYGVTGSNSGTDDEDWRQSTLHLPPTLYEHLSWQAEMHPFSDIERAVALHIVDAVDENGYLQDWPEISAQLLQQEDVTADLLEHVLTQVQEFDPPGIAARDTAECLRLQLHQLPADIPGRDAALTLLDDDGLALLAGHQPDRIAEHLQSNSETATAVLSLVQSLAPHPGSAFSRPEAEYVTPEVFVSKRRGRWLVSLNPEISPKLRINPEYLALVRRADASSEQQTLKQHLQDARFFLHSLKSRNDTLLRVAQCIVEAQRGFLDYGAEAMRPLILRDVAERLGIHESTVSRATAHKYMATPRGLYELKYFFSSQVATTTGGAASATAIQAMIRRLVQVEPNDNPHSDSKLAELLLAEGIKVARRTVAKYRELLHIPPSHERKPPA